MVTVEEAVKQAVSVLRTRKQEVQDFRVYEGKVAAGLMELGVYVDDHERGLLRQMLVDSWMGGIPNDPVLRADWLGARVVLEKTLKGLG